MVILFTMNSEETKSTNAKVVFNAIINSREMADMVGDVARKMVDTGCSLPEELEGIFNIEVITLPSGSKYARVMFA